MCFYINKEKETDSVIVFLHLPKSGGTTFNDIINQQRKYHPDFCRLGSCTNNGFYFHFDELTTEEHKRIEIIFGHIFFGIHQQLPQPNFTYITLLRHPIERIISSYYFHREFPHTRDLFHSMTLYDYVTNPDWNYNLWLSTANLQTHMLAGKIEGDLETAQDNLIRYFSVVGITERFDDSLKVCQKKLGWEINPYEKRHVVANRPEIPDEIIEIIKSKNEKDMALYQFANQLLDEELRSF